jgi:GNAT superfamily N-acetyltransferase
LTNEIAFLVADDAHGLGIATLLLERAATDARAEGVEWFVADVLAINHPMLEVFADAGFKVERHADHGDVALRMSTELDADARSATAARHAGALARTRGQQDGRPSIQG